MSYKELLQKLSQGMIGIQWEMTRCHDIYRLNKLAERLTCLAGDIADESKSMIEELENG
jgi:hypothetical protein